MKHYVICIGVCGREVIAHVKQDGPHPNALGLNGAGGELLPGEDAYDAAVREWAEEVPDSPGTYGRTWMEIDTLWFDNDVALHFMAAQFPRPQGPFTVDGLPGMLFDPFEPVEVKTAEYFVLMAAKAVEMFS